MHTYIFFICIRPQIKNMYVCMFASLLGNDILQWNLDKMNFYKYNKVLGITNNLLYPSDSKIYEKEPSYNETSL